MPSQGHGERSSCVQLSLQNYSLTGHFMAHDALLNEHLYQLSFSCNVWLDMDLKCIIVI
jgi:hypothetical protein